MKAMTFNKFIKLLAKHRPDNCCGDFLRAVSADPLWPEIERWKDIENYLLECNACDGTVAGARGVWLAFKHLYRRG